MITVQINKPQFEYDIHSLVRAFYPGREVRVVCEESGDSVEGAGLPATEIRREDRAGNQEDFLIEIQYGQESIRMILGTIRSGGSDFRVSEARHERDASRAEKKNLLKELIYRGLSRQLGMELPWGTLTGIRPTKIPMAMLEEGKSEEEILRHMQETYLISEEKGRLGIEIARRERELLSGLHGRQGCSLYIGIPFCPTTCLYCSFTSYPVRVWKKRVKDYLEALRREMASVAEICRDRVLDTVYIGGGTPTTLEPEELELLLTALEEHFDVSRLQEFTVEAGRADSITREKLRALKRHPVSRISVNPQTMKEETLKLIGRKHTVEQVREAFVLAREEGFDNINMDVILGLPGEDEEDVRDTMAQIAALAPDSLTVHSLAVKRASGMGQWIEENGMDSLKNTASTMAIAAQAAEEMGMQPYYLYRQKNMSGNLENVGYGKPGRYGIYNILIMEEKQDILALGAGSISKRVFPDGRIERCENVKDVASYMERIDEMIGRKRKLFQD
ncbi:MAG: coproporphyrinogen dehydrogenase HemZ [Lachnospiraceae bacterium]|nr:coproporphyrinogen dehydrogenase HemZ [Lachnospiraceae bacterium]